MSKAAIAAKMNASDNLASGVKTMTSKENAGTYKLVRYEREDLNHVEDRNGQVIGHLMQGSGNRWQLISVDCTRFANFDTKPNLARCLSFLGVK